MDVCQDLNYGAIWYRRSFYMKFFVDIYQNLSYGADFSRQANRPIFKVKRTLEWTLAFDLIGTDGKTGPLLKSNEPRSGDPDVRRHFCQKISWTYVKTLAMEPVGLDGKTDLFSRSNNSWSGFPMSFLLNLFVDVCKDHIYRVGWSRWGNRPIFKTLAMEPVGPDGETIPFSRSNDPQSV
ncbi:hypothetical protein H5410_056602 [Solanum commersonii]|uniref:Uncharacterized protein n=1 Tax=Solanum commersonii TaxID=4109 RepID=A0A9J5WMQ9_SOLCO|nr:hypothetical protein H5410_056602 [Solanum commersonii]